MRNDDEVGKDVTHEFCLKFERNFETQALNAMPIGRIFLGKGATSGLLKLYMTPQGMIASVNKDDLGKTVIIRDYSEWIAMNSREEQR